MGRFSAIHSWCDPLAQTTPHCFWRRATPQWDVSPTPWSYVASAAEHLASWRRIWLTPETIRRYQETALLDVVRRASHETPYFRRMFQEAGLQSQDVRSLADLSLIPLSDKATLQRAGLQDRLALGASIDGCAIHETSGSTGEPLRAVRSPDEELLLFGRRLRSLVLSGLRPNSRRVHLGSVPERNVVHSAGLFKVWSIPLTTDPDETIARLENLRPDIVKGPPAAMERLVDAHADRVRALRLRSLFTGAEQLSRMARTRLETAYGCRVVDFYGSVECNLIAWECLRCGRYHTSDDSVIVEVLKDGCAAQPGEEGEVVVTVLHSHVMPIIRYRLGDVVRLSAESSDCAIGFGSFESVRGRIVDYMRFEGGQMLSPHIMMDQLEVIEGISRYVVEQTGPNAVRVKYQLLDPSAQKGVAETIRARGKAALPEGVELSAEAVEHIVLEPNRKRRFVKAYVPTGS